MHTFRFCWYLREASGEHTYLPISRSPEEGSNFPGENRLKLGCFCITKIGLGEIFSRKKVHASNFDKAIKMKNTTMIQFNRIQLTRQTPSHVENTKMLSTSQPESRTIDC